jgi:hypothetical protein
MHNSIDIASIDEMIHSSNCADSQSFFMERTDFTNISPRKLGSAVKFPGLMVGPTFPFHIMDIIALCPKKEMLWIDAKSIITLMADANTFGNFASKKFPSDTMSQLGFTLKPNRSVSSSTASRADPHMATVRPIGVNFTHKSFGGDLDIESSPRAPCFHVEHYSSIVRNFQ